MTHITVLSKHYRIKVTDHTNEISEEIKHNIAGEEFIVDEGYNGKGDARGYVMVSLFGMVRQKYGPVELNSDDLE